MVTEEELQNMTPEQIAELQKQNCIFCKIISGEIPGKKVYEDDNIVAILDIKPAVKGHVLVMPKEHYPVLPLVPAETSRHMFRTIRDLCNSVRNGLPATGTTVFMANGAAAGQMSPHFLFHIIPRSGGDELEFFSLPNNEIDQTDIAEKLQQKVVGMMKMYLVQEGKLPPEEIQETVKQQAAILLEQNPQLKQVLMENPEAFKQAIDQNPQVAQMFQGIDIDALSEELNKLANNKKAEENVDDETAESGEESLGDKSVKEEIEGTAEEDKSKLDKISRLFK